MGALFGGQCYGSPADAAAAMWSGVGPVVSTGSPPVISTVELAGGMWQIVTRQSGVVLSVQDAPAVAFGPCDEAGHLLDGVALGWLVALVWVGAWSVHVLRRPLSWR
ncbi:MAG: hypothetical protein J0H00_10185 [Burkholderiales bacterium]|nr:hypothetical protein [Burkholderiales bacterium]OJX06646.1 MAG: hypothetical protein BGO72_16755 [Burkholderiales bacterium 70-64]